MMPRYPWRLGTTSFVLPAQVSENVAYLASQVDDIQLLFFESSYNAKLPHGVNFEFLKQVAADSALTYTVHLPLDLQLGADSLVARQQAINEVERLVNELAIIKPMAYDLHLNMSDGGGEKWLAGLSDSLSLLQRLLGNEWQKVNVENIDYDLKILSPLLTELDCRYCFDFGHFQRYGFDDVAIASDFAWAYDLLPKCDHIHLHGVRDRQDHLSLGGQDNWLVDLANELVAKEWQGVVTMEVYKDAYFLQSQAVLADLWEPFALK